MKTPVLITGGAGFIGSHLVDRLLDHKIPVVVLDLLTYAGSLDNLERARGNALFTFVQGDICDTALVASLLAQHQIGTLFHLAAESHVDNSIAGAEAFVQTNIVGTYRLLDAAHQFWKAQDKPQDFRFLHVSTDEVYGQLGTSDAPFTEESPQRPNSPYSASKAGSDHLARAWFHTYGLPVIITHCTNNFGPRQHNEKLIPTIIRTALQGQPIPIYGQGHNVRDWIFVQDHCEGLVRAATQGRPGEVYDFGSGEEKRNIDIARLLCACLDRLAPRTEGTYMNQITFVQDRPGHDWRYAIDSRKSRNHLGFAPTLSFGERLRETVESYLARYTPS